MIAMLRNQKVTRVLTLVLIGISGLNARNVSVINFKNWEKPAKAEAIPPSEYQQFDEIGLCFRIMIEVMKTVIILKMPHFYLYLKNNEKFIAAISLTNPRNGDLLYRQLFSLCQPYIPGEWVSLCFNMKFTRDTFEMTVVQNGQLCFQEEIEARFDFQLQQKLSLPDMLGFDNSNYELVCTSFRNVLYFSRLNSPSKNLPWAKGKLRKVVLIIWGICKPFGS